LLTKRRSDSGVAIQSRSKASDIGDPANSTASEDGETLASTAT
jgi:hypothetical protein